jgi:type IV secretion system protein VirB4
LANSSLDRAQYADLFHLNAMELDRLTELTPRRQLLLKRPGLAKVLTLNVDPHSYWLYTNSPMDNDRVAGMVREHGLSEALQRLATSA